MGTCVNWNTCACSSGMYTGERCEMAICFGVSQKEDVCSGVVNVLHPTSVSAIWATEGLSVKMETC